MVDGQEFQTLEDNYRQAKNLWKTQKEDDELEQEVIRSVQARREPARHIARRQKTTPRPKSMDKQEQQKPKQKKQTEEDGRQAMEDALVAWNGVILPLQVALEVTANLLSCLIQEEDAMAVKKDDEGLDQALHQALVGAKLAKRILQMLQTLCVFQSNETVLQVDLQDIISKCAACLSNCVLSKVLAKANFVATWQVL